MYLKNENSMAILPKENRYNGQEDRSIRNSATNNGSMQLGQRNDHNKNMSWKWTLWKEICTERT